MELCKEYKPLRLNENRENLSENFDLDFQENLPQYLDDINKVVKCSVTSTAVNYDINDSKLNIHGKTIICLTYLNNDNCMLSNIFEEEFSKSVDLGNCGEVAFADINIITKYSNFRLINQRRIDVHTSLNACVSVYCKCVCDCLAKCDNAFVRETDVPCLINKNAGIFTADFDEIFSVSHEDCQIKNIINTYGVCYIDDTKIVKDKALVKLKIEISVLYINDNDNIEKCRHTFSLSKIADISNCEEDDNLIVNASISNLYIKTKTNESNIVNEIEIIGCAAIEYKLYTQDTQSFITDSYVPRYKTQLSRSSLSLKESPKYFYDDRSDEMIFESDKDIIEILDLRARTEKCEIKNSSLEITVNLSFLYYDDESNLRSYENSSVINVKLDDSGRDGEGVISLITYDYVIKGTNKIALRLNYTYYAYLYSVNKIDYLTDIELGDEDNCQDAPQLTLYFADKGDNVWDIAKKFSTDMSLIMEENDLSSQIIENKMILLVPGM